MLIENDKVEIFKRRFINLLFIFETIQFKSFFVLEIMERILQDEKQVIWTI